jgi:hypothetical protein
MGSPFPSLVAFAWAGQCLLGEPLGTNPVSPFATFALRIGIAADQAGQPVADDTWLTTEIDTADALYASLGVQFVRTNAPPLDVRFEHIETRADRDALSPFTKTHFIDVFVVGSLRDIDDPSQVRRGVHWHGPSGHHYVILVASASPAVLAHELGHYFGNGHSPVVDNVMSYERSGGLLFFDANQGNRIVSYAKRYLVREELLPAAP